MNKVYEEMGVILLEEKDIKVVADYIRNNPFLWSPTMTNISIAVSHGDYRFICTGTEAGFSPLIVVTPTYVDYNYVYFHNQDDYDVVYHTGDKELDAVLKDAAWLFPLDEPEIEWVIKKLHGIESVDKGFKEARKKLKDYEEEMEAKYLGDMMERKTSFFKQRKYNSIYRRQEGDNEVVKNGWTDCVRKVVPYVPGEQPKESNIIKLNTNENPYPPAPSVRRVLDEFDISKMRLYPTPDAEVLVNSIAERFNLKPSQVFVGVGSDDVISMAFLTFFTTERPILFPDITYSFYDVWADVYRIPYKKIPLKSDFTLDADAFREPNGGIIFPNPNAPTGIFEDLSSIEEILRRNSHSVVIIDEAYIDFGGKSCLPLIERYENLLVVQTFSKSRSMAGMRIGFAMGSEKLIKYMNDVKFSINSYTMNTVTQLCGAESMKNEEYFRETVGKIVATRERTKRRLADMGFVFPDSKSNFIFAKPPVKSAEYVFNELKKRKIYVRWWDKPIINEYLRITIGTDWEMDIFIEAVREVLGI